MIDRRTFLKLSAGALVLTAAGALTGCGETVIDKTSGVAKIGDVTFICAKPFPGGGEIVSVRTHRQNSELSNLLAPLRGFALSPIVWSKSFRLESASL